MEMKTYLSELEYLVNIDSGSENPEGLNRMAAFFSGRFRDLGWIVKEYDLAPESGTLVVCANREAEHYDVMLIGHMDTVFPAGTCAQRPFRIENGRAYGPGVADMKQGCLLMYHLMADLPREINEKLNILVVFNPDEEVGSVYSKDIYLDYAQKTDYAFLYEARSVKGCCCVQRKGAVGCVVEFTGVQGHCGFVFKNGAKSAISEMARWIVKLDSLQSRERDTSVNIGVVNGGIKPNVVAEQANMTVDIRFSLPEEADRVEETLTELMEQAQVNGIGVQIKNKRIKQPWVQSEAGNAYLAHIEKLAADNGMEIGFETRGGLSDANYISQCGPICLDGMGPAGGKGHSPEEYLLLDAVEPTYEFSRLLLQDLADRKAD